METCSICLLDIDPYTDSYNIIKQVTCCKNKFHSECYTDWILRNPTCPLCRCIDVKYVINRNKLHDQRQNPLIIDNRIHPYIINNIRENTQTHTHTPTQTVITITNEDTNENTNNINTADDDRENNSCFSNLCYCNCIVKYRRQIMVITCIFLMFGTFVYCIVANGRAITG